MNQRRGWADKIKYAREAANVRRMHTMPIIKEYPVGQHTFHMLAMLRILYPEAPTRLIWAIVEHDMPERQTGDMPAPSKWFGLLNNGAVQDLEARLNHEWFGNHHLTELSHEERAWLHGLDLLEFYCFCLDEVMLGNRNMTLKVQDLDRVFVERADEYPPALLSVFREIQQHSWDIHADIGLEHLR